MPPHGKILKKGPEQRGAGGGWDGSKLTSVYMQDEVLTHYEYSATACSSDTNYTAKNDQVVAILICCAAHIVHSCQQYWTTLLHPIQAQQYCSILLTSVNNFTRV
jgi:hypothetical protein